MFELLFSVLYTVSAIAHGMTYALWLKSVSGSRHRYVYKSRAKVTNTILIVLVVIDLVDTILSHRIFNDAMFILVILIVVHLIILALFMYTAYTLWKDDDDDWFSDTKKKLSRKFREMKHSISAIGRFRPATGTA